MTYELRPRPPAPCDLCEAEERDTPNDGTVYDDYFDAICDEHLTKAREVHDTTASL